MAKTEVYTCDICKQSKSKEDLSKLTVRTEGINIKGVGFSGLQIDICADCLKKKGFVGLQINRRRDGTGGRKK